MTFSAFQFMDLFFLFVQQMHKTPAWQIYTYWKQTFLF